jgi:hypothetical protein
MKVKEEYIGLWDRLNSTPKFFKKSYSVFSNDIYSQVNESQFNKISDTLLFELDHLLEISYYVIMSATIDFFYDN